MLNFELFADNAAAADAAAEHPIHRAVPVIGAAVAVLAERATEFGRTLRENGNRGTDHGHGSVYWVLGGGISGGRVVGEQLKVQQSTLVQDRDYPVLNNYRALLGGIYSRLWGLSSKHVEYVFPQAKPVDLRLV